MDLKFGIQEFISLVRKEHLVQYQRPAITPISYSSPIKPKQNTSEINTEQKYGLLSTLGKSIVDDAFPPGFWDDVGNDLEKYKEKYRKLINGLLDDVSISQAINASENDPDFIQNYGNIGKLVEIYYSLFGHCPVCGTKTLRLFKNNNMPVVDLKCINATHNHTLGPSLWQVKATISDNYFSKNDKLISVGSRKWGENVHLDSNIPIEYKIGYICIKIHQREDNVYFINRRESFIVNPIQENFKYKYITGKGPWGHSRITWEGLSQDLPTLENNGIIDFDEIVRYIPTDLLGGIYQEEDSDDEITTIMGNKSNNDEIDTLNKYISELTLFTDTKNRSDGLLAPTPILNVGSSPKILENITEEKEMEIDQNLEVPTSNETEKFQELEYDQDEEEKEKEDEDEEEEEEVEEHLMNELREEIDIIEVMNEDIYNEYISSLALIVSEISEDKISEEHKLIKLSDMLEITLEMITKLQNIPNHHNSPKLMSKIEVSKKLQNYVKSIIIKLKSSLEYEPKKKKKRMESYEINYSI